MAETTVNAEELNPLTGNDDGKKQENMVEINLDNPRDPPQPTAQQQAQTAQQQQAVPQQDVPRKQDKDWAKEAGIACNKCYNWFPLSFFAWIGGWILIICGLFDVIKQSTNFIEFWLYVYLWIGGIIILIVDMPITFSIKMAFIMKAQLVIFDWVKLWRRIWGRTILYIIMMITCASFLANDDDPSEFRSVPWIAGIYLLIIIVLSYIFSYIAAKKYNAIRDFIVKATVIKKDGNGQDEIDEDQVNGMKNVTEMLDESKTDVDEEIVMKKLISKFEQLDVNNNGKLGMEEISKLGEECGNTFSTAEKYAVFLLLDKECNGCITRPEWILQLKKHKNLKML